MSADDIREAMLQGARSFQGLTPYEHILIMREALALPEPVAGVWDRLSRTERGTVVRFADLSPAITYRPWAELADPVRADLRRAMAQMAAWAVKLDAEARVARRPA